MRWDFLVNLKIVKKKKRKVEIFTYRKGNFNKIWIKNEMGFLIKPQNCEKKHRKLRFLLANMEMEKKKIKI